MKMSLVKSPGPFLKKSFNPDVKFPIINTSYSDIILYIMQEVFFYGF